MPGVRSTHTILTQITTRRGRRSPPGPRAKPVRTSRPHQNRCMRLRIKTSKICTVCHTAKLQYRKQPIPPWGSSEMRVGRGEEFSGSIAGGQTGGLCWGTGGEGTPACCWASPPPTHPKGGDRSLEKSTKAMGDGNVAPRGAGGSGRGGRGTS